MEIRPHSVVLAACAIGLASLGACNKHDEPYEPVNAQADEPNAAADPGRMAHTYSTRGIIKRLPGEGPASELQIQHEAIDTFVDASGKVSGMNAMTMPFPQLADGVGLDGYQVGDKVAFTFHVTWSEGNGGTRRPSWVVTSIEKLPDDTQLVFGKAMPPAEDRAVDAVPGHD